MTLTTPYSATFYVGDGETKTFPYLFEEVSESFISVIVYNSLTGQSSTPTYIVDTDQKQVIFGDDTPAPTADETVCIYRNTPNVQDTPFRTLQGYDAKALENILSKIVAMIQEIKSNYFTTQVLQGDPWQLDLLTSADDGATVNIDYTAKKLVKGLYFQITDGNLQVSADGSNYITMPKSDDIAEFRQVSITLEDLSVIKKLQYRVGNEWFDAEANAQATADEALSLAQTVQGGLSSHVSDTNNPHQTSLGNLTDTDFTNLQTNQFLKFNGTKWVNVSYSSICGWGGIIGNITDQTDLMNKFTEYVRTDGTSVMTAPLLMRATDDFKCAIAPYWDGVGFFKLNNNNSVTLIASLEYQDSFAPAENNVYNIGSTLKKWKNLYLAGKAYMSVINNGYDIAVPVTNSADTLALKSEVDLAANSGDQLTEKGVWYAKMYSATVAPSAEDGTNYADFSQTDGQGNPIIVIYKRQNGVWVQDQTITPPAEYNGYVPVTSKIWDIVEQAGQQGGKVLWSHNQKTFTPSPLIILTDGLNITNSTISTSTFSGSVSLSETSTVVMPAGSGDNQITNKKYVDDAISSAVSGSSDFDLFDTKWRDATTNNPRWALSDGNWKTNTNAYRHLVNESVSFAFKSSDNTVCYLRKIPVAVGDSVYRNNLWSDDTVVGTVLSCEDGGTTISVSLSGTTTTFFRYAERDSFGKSTQSEVIGGITINYFLAEDGHKICWSSEESNVTAIYNATGVAWYYIIDTTNQRFKLPRSKHNKYADSLGVAGNGMVLGLKNSTQNLGLNMIAGGSLTAYAGDYGTNIGTHSGSNSNAVGTFGITTDASKSGIVAQQAQDTDQYKYLYFYVGN